MERNSGHVFDNITTIARIDFSPQVQNVCFGIKRFQNMDISHFSIFSQKTSLGGGVGDDGKVPTLELPGRSMIINMINSSELDSDMIFVKSFTQAYFLKSRNLPNKSA